MLKKFKVSQLCAYLVTDVYSAECLEKTYVVQTETVPQIAQQAVMCCFWHMWHACMCVGHQTHS